MQLRDVLSEWGPPKPLWLFWCASIFVGFLIGFGAGTLLALGFK